MNNQLKITRHFNSDIDAVYSAWTDPEQFTKWMGPGTVTCVKFISDLRIGGKYEIHMQTEKGIEIAYGEYKEIESNRKLVFTWGWRNSELKDSLVTIIFSASDEGTELTLQHINLPTKDSADHHKLGWNGSIEKLVQFLSS